MVFPGIENAMRDCDCTSPRLQTGFSLRFDICRIVMGYHGGLHRSLAERACPLELASAWTNGGSDLFISHGQSLNNDFAVRLRAVRLKR
jgi:hypothetical protein